MLQLAVRHYVDTMEPVGSQTLVRRFGLQASPATVRSAMGALEQRGLLTQPHTSAGRIPSQQGYRTYVDQLLPAPGAAALQLERELTGLSLQWAALDDLLLHLSRRLADLTGLLSMITRPQRHQPQLQALRLVASGERLLVAVTTGLAGLLAQPEFSQTLSLRPLVELVEDAPQQLLPQAGIWIGAEHPHRALHQCAVVQANYRSGDGGIGQVALVGPMRMAYATARAAVRSVAQVLERLLD